MATMFRIVPCHWPEVSMRTTLASVPDVVSAGSWSAHTGHNVALDSLLREIMVRHELNRRGLVSGHRFFFFALRSMCSHLHSHWMCLKMCAILSLSYSAPIPMHIQRLWGWGHNPSRAHLTCLILNRGKMDVFELI